MEPRTYFNLHLKMKNICIVLKCANFPKNAKHIYNKSNRNNKISMLAIWFGILPRFSSPSWKILSIISYNPSWYLNHWLNTLHFAALCSWKFLKGQVSNYLVILSSIFVSKCLTWQPPTPYVHTPSITDFLSFILYIIVKALNWCLKVIYVGKFYFLWILVQGSNRGIKICLLENGVYLVW